MACRRSRREDQVQKVGAMDRVVVLTVDEVSVLIGLLDARWSGTRPPDPSLSNIATRYEKLLWSRAVDVSDTTADRATVVARLEAARAESARLREQLVVALAEGRGLCRRRDELVAAVRAAVDLLGTEGPLEARAANDPDLADVRALLSTVAAA
jgi:hypothetical protein